MHILDAIRNGGETQVKARKLCADYGYDPTQIGCAVLKACGYEVRRYLKGDISVKSSDGQLLFFTDYPDYDL